MSCKRHNTFEVLCPVEMELLGEWSSEWLDSGGREDRLVGYTWVVSS